MSASRTVALNAGAVVILGLFSFPDLLFAGAPGTFKAAIELVLQLLQNLIVLLISLLGLGMVFGVAMYMVNSDNEQKREQIKGYLLWGVIGIMVVFALFGIVAVFRGTLFGDWDVGIPHLTRPP